MTLRVRGESAAQERLPTLKSMIQQTGPIGAWLLPAVLIAAVAMPAAAGKKGDQQQLLGFALNMARKGNWREARFRWEQALSNAPQDPYVMNNLAVSLEAMGDSIGARAMYSEAGALSGHPNIAQNARRNQMFLKSVGELEDEGSPRDLDYTMSTHEKQKKKGPKSTEVLIQLPVEPRLELEGRQELLVASFLVPDSNLMDINMEIVRYLRNEYQDYTSLDVLDVMPPPAIPEQRLEDLKANDEFWRHLGQEHETDLIVSGLGRFGRHDSSGWRSVDYTSPTTGQKIRQTQFVEMEEFNLSIDILYIDGKTGECLLHDTVQRTISIPGVANDPLTVLDEIGNLIQDDVLSAVVPRTRQDIRLLFRG